MKKPKAFQYKVPKTKGAKVIGTQTMILDRKEDPGAGEFGSTQEAWAYNALLKLGWKESQIELQDPIYGGRDWPGGFIIDLILYTPMPIAISIKGRYWHDDPDQEQIDDARIQKTFTQFVVVWDNETPNFEAMVQVLEDKVGRP